MSHHASNAESTVRSSYTAFGTRWQLHRKRSLHWLCPLSTNFGTSLRHSKADVTSTSEGTCSIIQILLRKHRETVSKHYNLKWLRLRGLNRWDIWGVPNGEACPFNGSIREISCRRHHDGRGWISFTDRFIRDARELPLVTLFRLVFYTREPNEISVSKSREFTFYRHFFSCQEVPDAWIMDGPFKLLKKGFSNFNCSWGLGQLRLRGQIASRWNRRQ